MTYKGKTQAQTLRSGGEWRKKRKCSLYALLLKNGANLLYYTCRVHVEGQALWRSLELDCHCFLTPGEVPGASESKHAWRNTETLASTTERTPVITWDSLSTHKSCSTILSVRAAAHEAPTLYAVRTGYLQPPPPYHQHYLLVLSQVHGV